MSKQSRFRALVLLSFLTGCPVEDTNKLADARKGDTDQGDKKDDDSDAGEGENPDETGTDPDIDETLDNDAGAPVEKMELDAGAEESDAGPTELDSGPVVEPEQDAGPEGPETCLDAAWRLDTDPNSTHPGNEGVCCWENFVAPPSVPVIAIADATTTTGEIEVDMSKGYGAYGFSKTTSQKVRIDFTLLTPFYNAPTTQTLRFATSQAFSNFFTVEPVDPCDDTRPADNKLRYSYVITFY